MLDNETRGNKKPLLRLNCLVRHLSGFTCAQVSWSM